MEQSEFQQSIEKYIDKIELIKESAHQLHDSVNQRYAVFHPYGFHLDMVVNCVRQYGSEVCVREEDLLPLFLGAYYHDSIEDARLTYNDVVKIAKEYMDERQALMAAEIVYALTNDKGRTRAERAGEKYYAGIRDTAYAPFVKAADRLANVRYSCQHGDALNAHMKDVYANEMPRFIKHVTSEKAEHDVRFAIPKKMMEELLSLAG